MYSLDVNFLRDRAGYEPTAKKAPQLQMPAGDLTPLFVGLGVGIAIPLFLGAGWWFLEAKNNQLSQQIVQLEEENKRLEVEIGNIDKIREETKQVKAETQGLVTVFDQIRPWSAMLQDFRDRIPETVQIDTITQMEASSPRRGERASNEPEALEIEGFARSFNDVNDFVLTLQQSQFLESSSTKIATATLVDAPLPPGVDQSRAEEMKLPQVVRYTIQSNVSQVPASELIRELEQKGSVGLVSRIRSMQRIGVISK
ncbi:PilN domain-containing protein [Nodularia harveyana UHCC-0300]|uniref:PilN domain-containing protein n=1 Tax=Nodularia harveyana UHCC-0300 TaxID=2974287 RepID=A0ABU5UJH7_9CYAN|nr:PilN domain-containing protein [Nodularia harveyana]MEA5583670.1 PilN domain-containing protein [Nodularia harveyana UHCC-0300]